MTSPDGPWSKPVRLFSAKNQSALINMVSGHFIIRDEQCALLKIDGILYDHAICRLS